MPSPPKRPRDKGGTSLQHVAARDFESSNSTMAMFLGSKKKGWMTGEPMTTDHPSTHRLQKSNSTTPRLGFEDARTENLPPAASAAQSCKSPSNPLPMASLASERSPKTMPPARTTRVDLQIPKPQKSRVDTVLPSPTPSDEFRQGSIYIIDLEVGREQEIGSEQQLLGAYHTKEQQNARTERHVAEGQSNHLDDLNTTQTNKSAEKHGEIEYIRTHPPCRESIPPDQRGPVTTDPQPEAPSAYLGNTMQKRTMIDELPAKKRFQRLAPGSPVNPNRPRSQFSTVRGTNSMATAINFSPSEAELRQFVGRITSRLEFVQRAQVRRGSTEDGRLLLLRDACECHDHDYLLLHQLHCMKSRNPGCVRQFSAPGFGTRHLEGLNILDLLIRANAELVDDAVEWFSNFPLPNRELLERYTAYQLSYGRVLKCLEKLAEFWQQLRKLCQERHYVPLVDELNALDLRSIVLQRVIARAILRNIWLLPQDECFHSSEKLFLMNQQDVYQRDNHVATSPAIKEANKKNYNLNMVASYQTHWDQHQQHRSQYVQDAQAENGRNFPNAVPQGNVQREQPQQTQTRFLPARSASSDHAQLVDQAHKSRTLNINLQVDQRNGQLISGYAPALTSSPLPGVQLGPFSRNLPPIGQRALSSALPPSRIILPSNTESIETGHGPAITGHPNVASTPTTFHGHLHNQHSRRSSSMWSMPRTSSPGPPSESTRHSTQPEIGFDSSLPRVFGRTEPSPRSLPAEVPSSLQDSQVIDVHRQHFDARGQSRARVQIPSHRPSVNLANGQLIPSETHRLQIQSQFLVPPQFLPRSGYIQETNPHPNPLESALHQAHVRSPILTVTNTEGEFDKITKYFRFMWGLAVMPNRLHMQKRHVRWTFTVNKESVQLLAKSVEELDGSPPTRTINTSSRLCRIRCVKVSDTGRDLSEDDWAVAENTWPRNVAIILNGTALEIRRKLHHGKDLPVDVSQYIQEGQNTLSIATMWLPQENEAVYAVGLETLQVTTDKRIKESLRTLERSEAQKRIIEHASNVDPDVQIIDPSIVLDLTDPYTSSIFEIPLRGKNCRHNQCFDLDVFLQTRTSKSPSETCGPDQFKCPLCGGDARPQSLVVDGFFKEVREELARNNRLDARAIVMHESGEWQIKEVEETGESGDGSGRRPSRSEEDLSAGVGMTPIRRESEVIDIDDE